MTDSYLMRLSRRLLRPLSSLLGSHVNPPERTSKTAVIRDSARRKLKRRQRLRRVRESR